MPIADRQTLPLPRGGPDLIPVAGRAFSAEPKTESVKLHHYRLLPRLVTVAEKVLSYRPPARTVSVFP